MTDAPFPAPESPLPPSDDPALASSPDGDLSAKAESRGDETVAKPRQRILIGSQRDPAAYRARRVRDWVPVVEPEEEAAEKAAAETDASAPPDAPPDETPPAEPVPEAYPGPIRSEAVLSELIDEPVPLSSIPENTLPPTSAPDHFPAPNSRAQLPPDLEAEFAQALGDASAEELMVGGSALVDEGQLLPESKHEAKIVAIRRDDVFVELGGREQGIIPLQQFKEPPQIGSALPVFVQRFNAEEGLYELNLPGAAVQVEDWSDLHVGAIVEARVTGHNTGGLECTVNTLRGFIPVSHVALYRVENLEEFIGQHFPCVVTEADPERRNLVLSRRAMLEREREEARQKMLASLQPGQIHEGVVRKLMDFGAFVELADGVDGLVHVSQLAWGRVNHPRDVLHEGQRVRVRIDKVDPVTQKIGLSYKDLLENPWQQAAQKYPSNSTVHGRVTRIMEYGAFVELEPGVEGLIHVSQLSHKRVMRVSDVVKEGQEVEVLVLSIDLENQRVSLSMKALSQPEPEAETSEAAPVPPAKPKKTKPEKEIPLQGGLGKATGQRFGLKW